MSGEPEGDPVTRRRLEACVALTEDIKGVMEQASVLGLLAINARLSARAESARGGLAAAAEALRRHSHEAHRSVMALTVEVEQLVEAVSGEAVKRRRRNLLLAAGLEVAEESPVAATGVIRTLEHVSRQAGVGPYIGVLLLTEGERAGSDAGVRLARRAARVGETIRDDLSRARRRLEAWR